MRIALIGYGTMGKTIEQVALERGHTISLRLDVDRPADWEQQLAASDAAIEFTTPGSAVENIFTCFRLNVPVVVGTTGWYEQFERVKAMCLAENRSLFYATNFSVGVNLFFELNTYLARLMVPHDDYTASLEEIHHIRKKDAPSGTAITLAEQLIAGYPAYSSWQNTGTAPEGILPIVSVRRDDVPGTHTVRYTSAIDQIEITHTAFNRRGFALGAVLAAEFMPGKTGIYTMSDLLKQASPHGI